jgi:hypothetical protein
VVHYPEYQPRGRSDIVDLFASQRAVHLVTPDRDGAPRVGLCPLSGAGVPAVSKSRQNAPSPALFDLVLWNVVISFFVNLLASAAFERARRWKRREEEQGERPFTADQIALLREEIRRELDGLPTPQRHALVGRASTGPLEPLLYSFGLPSFCDDPPAPSLRLRRSCAAPDCWRPARARSAGCGGP